MTRQLYVAFFLVSCYWLIRFRQGVIVKIQGSVKKKYVCEPFQKHWIKEDNSTRHGHHEIQNTKCVITGMPEKMSTDGRKRKSTRHGHEMLHNGTYGRKSRRKKKMRRGGTLMKMLHNGIGQRISWLLPPTVGALTGFAETSEQDGTAATFYFSTGY